MNVRFSATVRTARAWELKEAAANLWRYKSRTWAVAGWNRWLDWASRCRLDPVVKAARMVREHLWGIVNAASKCRSGRRMRPGARSRPGSRGRAPYGVRSGRRIPRVVHSPRGSGTAPALQILRPGLRGRVCEHLRPECGGLSDGPEPLQPVPERLGPDRHPNAGAGGKRRDI